MPLEGAGTDHWLALVAVDHAGDWQWKVRAWTDEWESWLHAAEIKVPAGIDIELVFATGAQLLERAGHVDVAATLRTKRLSPASRLATAAAASASAALRASARALVTESESLVLRVERERAGVGSWYEFFPRSEGAKKEKDGTWVSGTFRSAARRLPAVAAMGFDVLYLPPIHPIGTSFRKGKNNTLDAKPGDPGSPWAIGAAEGGHDAIHPDLGDIKDFTYFLGVAAKNGIEVAIDLALQASPDHPWVTEHPEWFTTRVDGSIAFAETPP
jgi:starch synthase (maltosyl-transferring)